MPISISIPQVYNISPEIVNEIVNLDLTELIMLFFCRLFLRKLCNRTGILDFIGLAKSISDMSMKVWAIIGEKAISSISNTFYINIRNVILE